MAQVQIIQETEEFKQDLTNRLKTVLLEELRKEFQPKQPTEYLTRAELADLLKINLSTIHHWSKKGIIKRHSIGNRIYYKRSEIESNITSLDR